MNWHEILQDVDIAEFCEKYLGVKLLEYQKVMLRNLYKTYDKSENEFYQRAFPFSTYRLCCMPAVGLINISKISVIKGVYDNEYKDPQFCV